MLCKSKFTRTFLFGWETAHIGKPWLTDFNSTFSELGYCFWRTHYISETDTYSSYVQLRRKQEIDFIDTGFIIVSWHQSLFTLERESIFQLETGTYSMEW